MIGDSPNEIEPICAICESTIAKAPSASRLPAAEAGPPRFERAALSPAMTRRIMTEPNRMQRHRLGRAISPDQFILWIEPGANWDIQTMASPLRSGEILDVGRLDRIFRDLIDALQQSDSHDRP